MKIVIGSRKSDLARIQARAVGEALQALPEVSEVSYHFKSSLGDQNQSDPLWQMPEKGVFTQDLTKDLMAGAVDVVVHSWKDLPVEERKETLIAATLPREDQRDLLLFRKDRLSKLKLDKSVRIFSSSPRRAYNLSRFLSWALPGGSVEVNFEDVRGNIQTRVQKLLESDTVDALVVAKAAVDRILSSTDAEYKESWSTLRKALDQCEFMVLPLKENPTAAAQGALAIEVSRDRTELISLLENLNCSDSFELVQKERQILKSYGGGCHQKIGVACLKRAYGSIESLRGLSEAGEDLDRWQLDQDSFHHRKADESFPLEMAGARLMDDEDVDFEKESLRKARGVIVAKSRAWPQDMEQEEGQILWVAGLRSWRKLAVRGLWIHGSFEGLGDGENPRLESLLGPVKWLKVTHTEAVESDLDLATYRLVDRDLPADLPEKKYYFWTSFSSFQRAVKAFPEIEGREHFCGPGKTAKLIEKHLGRRPGIYLSFKEWKNEFQ